MTGGYGLDRAIGALNTKPVLTAINLPGIVKWVTEPGDTRHSVAANIRQLYNPIFQITGGAMFQLGSLTPLIFGQNFIGVYSGNSNDVYGEQVRQFKIKCVGGQLLVDIYNSKPYNPDPNSANTFKQAMNNYASATAGLYSKKSMNMYHLLFGGIS